MAKLTKGGQTINHDGDVKKALRAHPKHNGTPSNIQRPRRLRLS